MQAKKSYERDLAAIRRSDAAAAAATVQIPERANEELEHRSSLTFTPSSGGPASSNGLDDGSKNDWTYDEASGYHFNAATGYYYDPNSGLYYSDILGKWTTQEEALKASQDSQLVEASSEPQKLPGPKQSPKRQQATHGKTKHNRVQAKNISSLPPGSVVVKIQGPVGVGRGVASSLEVGKRKRVEKVDSISPEEAAALEAREAARKRTQDREKSMLGLYQTY